MEICKRHWQMLRDAIEKRGLSHLVSKSGEDVIRKVVTELEGREVENDFDPLMACNNMIWSQGINVLGLSLFSKESLCPICEAINAYELWWIDGPADSVLKECKEKGLI